MPSEQNSTLHHLASYLDGEALTKCMGYNPSDMFTDCVRQVLWLYLKLSADIVAMTPTLATAHNSCRNSLRSHSYKHILVVKMITLTS